MATIRCRDCGTQRHRVPANTRYCKRCRFLRNLDYWRRRTRRCADCAEIFAPIDRNDLHCSKCDPGLRAHAGRCALSKDNPHEGRYLHPALPVCASCARAPEMRSRLIRALEFGQADRLAKYKADREET